MENKLLTIKEAAKKLNVSTDTLRRWDKKGKLVSVRGKNNYRYYKNEDIDNYLSSTTDIFKLANNWVQSDSPNEPLPTYYCKDSSIFQSRLIRLKDELSKRKSLKNNYYTIVSIAGEIGDNSYAHNFGNWPDIMGVFFAYDIKSKKIVLADRGLGVLKTLSRVKPELKEHSEALRTAFTEVLSGRFPEARGNGLKYVRKEVLENNFELSFQTGNAKLDLKKNNDELNIKLVSSKITGCLILIRF